MPLFCLFVVAVLGVTMLDGIAPGGGFVWDFLNGLGFGALAGLVYLGWDSESPARQPRLRLHSSLALGAVALAAAHAAGLIVADPLVLEYLKLKAPWYMHAGLVAFICMVVLSLTSFPPVRRRVFARFAQFRLWHRVLAAAALGLAAWHVLGAAFYASASDERRWLAVLLLAVPAAAFVWRRAGGRFPRQAGVASSRQADRDAVLGTAAAIAAACLYAALKLI